MLNLTKETESLLRLRLRAAALMLLIGFSAFLVRHVAGVLTNEPLDAVLLGFHVLVAYGRTDDGTFFYVMEYLPGLSLQDLIERHGPLPAERVVHLLQQACQALREAHHVGLIHRDIKPANVFAAQRGGLYDVVKLLDFGLVKPVGENTDRWTQRHAACWWQENHMIQEEL